jgi:uncharacterized protein (DUF2336 family)
MRFAEHAFTDKTRFDEVYVAVANLFEHQNSAFTKQERELAADILRRLSKDVEMSIRIQLAVRMAGETAAPQELILLLAQDDIEVARPVLERSPILSDEDLVRIVEGGTENHQIAVAERPAIGVTVSAALERCACELAVIALLRNASAKIGPETFDLLGERARMLSRLQEPLIERQDLPPALVRSLAVWLSGGLKAALVRRYPDAAQSLSSAIDETAASVGPLDPPVPEISAKKLIEKLRASGQLRASFLIRVLNQGQMELFEHGFAALLELDVKTMRKALYGRPMRVALACRAAGIDRSVFMTVFKRSRYHRGVTALVSDSEREQIEAVFSGFQKTEALDRLRGEAA